MSNQNETAMVNANESYLALRDFNMADIMAQEMAGLNASFDRIKIPSGGGTVFEVAGDDPDNPDVVKELYAVILYQHPLNAYYKTEYTGGNNPPDCGSYDGVCGVGDPGGVCASCPNNVFGTGKNGAKACKNKRRMYLLREGELFPILLTLPTGSLKGFTRYLMRVLPKYKSTNAVVTKFTLKKVTNKGGTPYSEAQFAVARALSPEEFALVSRLSEQVKEMASSVGYDVDEENAPLNVDPETGEIIEPLA